MVANLVLLCRALRACGFTVGAGAAADVLQALQLVGLHRREDVFTALRCLLVHRADMLELFDQVVRRWWQELERNPSNAWLEARSLEAALTRQALARRLQEAARHHPWIARDGRPGSGAGAGTDGPSPAGPPGAAGMVAPSSQAEPPGVGLADGSPASARRARGGYSPLESLQRARLEELSPAELHQLARLLARLGPPPRRRSRVTVAARRGVRWDLARTARRALASGGELSVLVRRRCRVMPRRLVVLLDTSGSMEPYARAWLAALWGLARRWGNVEVFSFGTRLSRLTPYLRRGHVNTALAAAAGHIQDWAGGTRIGQCLRQLQRRWAKGLLRQGASLLVVSDGWDRGDTELLRRAMAGLRLRTRLLAWVVPYRLQREAGGLPEGLATALPYLDALASVSTVAELHRLARWLAREARRFAPGPPGSLTRRQLLLGQAAQPAAGRAGSFALPP